MPDNTLLQESVQAFAGGVNDRLDPLLLKDGTASRLMNVSVRDGLAESRPSLTSISVPVQGKFQGAFEYVLNGDMRWVLVVDGQVWTYRFETGAWAHAATFPTTDFEQAYFCQAGKYGIVQNGIHTPVENWPIILDGDSPVDNLAVDFIMGDHIDAVGAYNPGNYDDGGNWAPPTPQLAGTPSIYRVPIGKSMAFGQGRLFVAVDRYWDNGLSSGLAPGWRSGEGLRFILASDDERWDDQKRMLVFQQNDLLNGGGALMPPMEAGFITSMGFFRNAATGTGLGELVVLSQRGSSVFAVSVARGGESNQWSLPGFGQVLFTTSGSSSPWALTAVNSDLVYRGDGGLRTLRYTATNETASGGMAVLPVSTEVTTLASRTKPEHEPFVTATRADNYVLFTSNGRDTAGGVLFTDAIVWDLSSFQSGGEAAGRVFAGAWRGDLYHAVLQGGGGVAGAVYRATETGPIRLGLFSGTGDGQESVVRTRAFAFGGAFTLKRVKYVDLMLDRVSTALAVSVRWRADGGGWYESDVRRFLSTAARTTGPFRVPVEVDSANPGYLLEFAISWIGHARLKAAAFSAGIAGQFTGGEDAPCTTVDLDLQDVGGVAFSPEE